MREYATPTAFVLTGTETTLDDIDRHVREHPDHVGFSIRGDGDWRPVTYAQFAEQVADLARGLVTAGIGVGDRVALMSRNRYEWALCDYAIWRAGAVTVPIYETSSAEQVEWILSDSGAVAAFVELPRHRETMESVLDRVPAVRQVWDIEGGDLPRLVESGTGVGDDVLAERRAAMSADSLASIIYTSGTTGRPKGCPITHGNFAAVYNNVTAAPGIPGIFNAESSTLLFIPLAHSLARIIQLACIHARVHIGYTPDAKKLPEDLLTFHPTLILSVPRAFEKLYNGAQRKAYSGGRVSRTIFDRADHVAVRYSESLDGSGPGPLLRAEHALMERLVYRKVRDALGGRVRWSVSGGAPLGERLGHFFRGVGVTVLEGYGLTETMTGGTLNLPARQRVGTVGPPIPGSTVRIAHDGEILLHGRFVFDGYWQNDVATKETIDEDGWLHSGDIGQVDDQGYVTITGRKKELIVTAGGKNVAPAVLEDRLRAHWLVSQCMVVGDRRPYIACLITLDTEMLDAWKAEHGRPASVDLTSLTSDPELLQDLQEAVDEANQAVSQAESIRKFAVLATDFTEADGQLTPTLKLKRDVVANQFADEIEALYSS